MMNAFETRPGPRLVFGEGRLAELPEGVRSVGGTHVLLVTDPGIVAAGHVERATRFLVDAGVKVSCYEGTHENPSESDVEACRAFAAGLPVDCILGLGGGSSMDTAKGCNFLLADGGTMADFRGYGKVRGSMLPLIAVPTTAGTGSECQSFALVSSDASHEKMACGDPKALARIALLDPELTVSQPRKVATLTALDAMAHALETAVCTKSNPLSRVYSKESVRLIESAIEMVLQDAALMEHRGAMMLGAAFSGLAIENSMLGGAHAAANPLTARFEVVHGHAVALMLPHVMRYNRQEASAKTAYLQLSAALEEPVIDWVERIVALAGLPGLAACGVTPEAIDELAEDATKQWTGTFNPRPLAKQDFVRLYEQALERETVSA
jgi:alcohol dehydrogenase